MSLPDTDKLRRVVMAIWRWTPSPNGVITPYPAFLHVGGLSVSCDGATRLRRPRVHASLDVAEIAEAMCGKALGDGAARIAAMSDEGQDVS